MNPRLKIALVEPYYGGSHKQWADDLKDQLDFEIHIFSLKDKNWKWRMLGGAIPLVNQIKASKIEFDLFLVTDMIDLALFKSLLGEQNAKPFILYFHESQLTYPKSPQDSDIPSNRNYTYGFINFTSALVADKVVFNSQYHKTVFLEGVSKLLKAMPDKRCLEEIAKIEKKSFVLHLGLKLNQNPPQKAGIGKILLWNHRWDADKNPLTFEYLLSELSLKQLDFKLIMLGERKGNALDSLERIEEKYADKILFSDYAESKSEYNKWLAMADYLPVTSLQDFFGISVIEAMSFGVLPILPRRLAFPEHIPKEAESELFYNKDEELFEKTKAYLMGDYDSDKLKELRLSVASWTHKYDWSNMKPLYEKFLLEASQEVE